MAGKQIQGKQNNVYHQHQRPHADTEMQLLVRTQEPESADRVIPEEAQEDDGAIKKIAVQILQYKRKLCFPAVIAIWALTHGACRWIHKEGSIIGLAIVITSHAKAERKGQDQQGRRKRPPVVLGIYQWRIKRREIGPPLVKPAFKGAERGVDAEPSQQHPYRD